jgi:hypothetical protein
VRTACTRKNLLRHWDEDTTTPKGTQGAKVYNFNDKGYEPEVVNGDEVGKGEQGLRSIDAHEGLVSRVLKRHVACCDWSHRDGQESSYIV